MNRRTSLIVVHATLAFLSLLSTAALGIEAKAVTEAESRILGSIKYLAGDELGGRGIGTEGIRKASIYLAEQFSEMGLRTDLYESGPFQEFSVPSGVEMGSAEENRLVFVGPIEEGKDQPQRIEFEIEEDFFPLAVGGSGEFQAPLAFVGYGISSEREGYDDYADIDVEGKVVVMLRKEPQQKDPHSAFDGRRSTVHAQFRRKVQNAEKHGAVAVVLVNDSVTPVDERDDERQRMTTRLRRLRQMAEELSNRIGGESDDDEFDREALLKMAENLADQIESLRDTSREINRADYDPIVGFRDGGTRSEGSIPVFFATRKKVNRLLERSIDKELKELEVAIDAQLEPQSQMLEGWTAEGATKVIKQRKEVRNVLAVLEGEGPLADKTIVVGAHYDHLGRGGPGTLAPWTDEIHNGADDNASGTTALLEVARAMVSRDSPPRHRIVFIGFTGEESGLLGSEHYVKDPRFPLEDTVAMVNLDMVGRLRDNELNVQGTGTAKQFDELVERLNEKHEFNMKKVASGYGPSDHASFYGAEVPVIFLFTGLHSDYHRPSDDWDKINLEGVRRIVDFASDILIEIDGMEERPTYVATRRGGRFGRNRNRVVLGIIPAQDRLEEEGVAIGGLSEGGSAEAAGLQENDLIVQMDDKEIKGLEDLRAVLGEKKPNDEVAVIVRRGSEKIKIDVKLKSN